MSTVLAAVRELEMAQRYVCVCVCARERSNFSTMLAAIWELEMGEKKGGIRKEWEEKRVVSRIP